MSERWVLGTCMIKMEDGSYAEGKTQRINVPRMNVMDDYTASDGQVFTHIQNAEIDCYMKEPITHFLPEGV